MYLLSKNKWSSTILHLKSSIFTAVNIIGYCIDLCVLNHDFCKLQFSLCIVYFQT